MKDDLDMEFYFPERSREGDGGGLVRTGGDMAGLSQAMQMFLAKLARSFVSQDPYEARKLLKANIFVDVYPQIRTQVSFFLVDPENRTVSFSRKPHLLEHDTSWSDYRLTCGENVQSLEDYPAIERVLETGKPYLSNDVHADPLFEKQHAEFTERSITVRLIVPVSCKGEVYGVLVVSRRESNVFNEQDVVFFEQVADIVGMGVMHAWTQDDLREKGALLDSIQNATLDGVSIMSPDRTILWHNQRIAEGQVGSVVGRKCYEAFEKRSEICPHCVHGAIYADGKPREYESVVIAGDGENAHMWVRAEPIKNEQGEVTSILEAARNITERKKAEQALKESEERFRMLAEQNLLGLAILQDDCVKYVNEAICEITGYSAGDLVGGGSELFVRCVHPDDVDFVLEQSRKKQAGETEGVVTHYSYRIVRKDEKQIWVDQYSKNISYEGKSAALVSLIDITERRRVEDALQGSESRYRRAIAQADAFTYTFDYATDSMTFIDERISELTRYPVDDFSGGAWRTMIKESVMQGEGAGLSVEEASRRIKSGELKAWRCDYRIVTRDGKELWLADSSIPLHDDSGDPVGSLGIIQNITERKHAEVALRKSEERYRNVYDTAPLAFVLWDCDCRVTGWNDRAEYIFGWSREEVMGKVFFDFLIPENARPRVEDIVKHLLDGEIESDVINENLTKSGETVLCCWNNSIQRDEKGNIIGVMSLALDITERRWAEKALQESEERYRAIFEQAPDSIILLDSDAGELVDFNDRAHQDLGYSREEFRNLKIFDIDAVESSAEVSQHIQRIEQYGSDTFETKHRKKDGEIREIHVSSRTLSLANRRMIQSVWTDITERKHMERQLRQAARMEAIGTMAGGIAHDFNNILSLILGYGIMARDDSPQGSTIRKNLDRVVRAGKRARNLVEQILTYSRQAEHERKPIQVDLIVKEVLSMLRATLPATIWIRYNIRTDTCTVMADPVEIHQILMNLCANASQAMHDDAGALTVNLDEVVIGSDARAECRELTEGNYLRLAVTDTGDGMEPGTIERIFDPFFTTKPAGEGTGMGLSTVMGIVAGLGGAITVESELDEGATFNVYLPMCDGESDGEVADEAPVLTGNERILLVDDEEEAVEMARKMLERLGYTVTSKTQSLKALEAFRAAPDEFDLVITDQTMPLFTGMELCREIIRLRPDKPIVMITGHSESAVSSKALSLGVRIFTKPLVFKEFAKTIRDVLDQ
ncbi:PAS domain S-box protein [Candidatus Hydrogenedentota bacterium]